MSKALNVSSDRSLRGSIGKQWNRFVAIVALANLLLIMFNISYIPLRNIYLRYFPAVVALYDPVKGIQVHPETKRYLETVDTLAKELFQEGVQTEETATILASLRQQSDRLLAENPFLVSNKFGTFAKLKRRMRDFVNRPSASEAFAVFWSQEYLEQVGWPEALDFFNQKIRFWLSTSYLRDVDENGQVIDEFWRIDIFFIVFFAVNFLIRTFWRSLQKKLSWSDVMLRRWYEGLLLLPKWRLLRVIPVSVYLHRSGLINLERILAEMTHEPAAYLADRVSVFLMVRLLNQTKDAVASGEMARMLLQSGDYIQVSDVNKFDKITDRLLQISIYKVLPQVQPEIEDLLHYSLKGAIADSEFYQLLQQIPGFEVLPAEVIEQLANYLSQSLLEILVNSYSDLEGKKLLEQLTGDFQQKLRLELQDEATQQELQSLLADLLEELKINYIQESNDRDPEATLTEAEQLRQNLQG